MQAAAPTINHSEPGVQCILSIPTANGDNVPSKELTELNTHLADDWKFVSMVSPSCGNKVIVCIEKHKVRVQNVFTSAAFNEAHLQVTMIWFCFQ